MKLALHNYRTNPSLSQRDGVNLAYTEIATLLARDRDRNVEVQFHDFPRLLADERYAYEQLVDIDCAISNVGPHAHYYFYLREKLGLDFRIVRDCREAMRSNYLLQEYLIQPFLRADDALLFVSSYGQLLFESFFPHLLSSNSAVCYPFVSSFPRHQRSTRADGRGSSPFVIGYVGRLSEDKNFPQLVDLVVDLNRSRPGGYRLVAVGDVHSPSCDPERIARRVRQEVGCLDCFEYHSPVGHTDVWRYYETFDAFVFPSTSNIETLGRVLIEASYKGVPILASDHAAAADLIPSDALVPVQYRTNQQWSTHFDFPLGEVNLGQLIEKFDAPRLVQSDCWRLYASHAKDFLSIITSHGLPDADRMSVRPDSRSPLLGRVRLMGMPESRAIGAMSPLIDEMRAWFVDLHSTDPGTRGRRLAALRAMSLYPDRTHRYGMKVNAGVGDFTNVGGIDFELCHVARFYPSFDLARCG